ncbi:asparaginase [Paenibacillus eucommiae]|uniref:L-asparaginase II n=1 Tax=Paenibacillus eucommiae TaxID=1355755 RepID=A0ABS4IWL2_9BACL|nr:asparaginase [Paenibacillus eucommiae]MBP1991986.1 L-asparaginase II [Paenibacillus eucommiae]
MNKLLVQEYRGELVECEYEGHICGISYSGDVMYQVGNPQHVTYMRSAAKPIQAIPAFRYGIGERYHFDEKEQTIMTASHRAEPYQVQALESMLGKIGIDESELVCHSTYPLNADARHELVAQGKPERHLYHNCSGKHLGILAYSKSKGYSTSDYADPKHPVQQEILATLAMLAEYPAEQIVIGIDGCGFPVFGLPLHHMAKAFLKLACPELIEDKITRSAVEQITQMMNRNFEMVSGTGLICSTLLKDDNIVAKGGAKGVYCFGLKKEKLAFALKVMDGSEEKWPLIVASILEQINYDRQETIDWMYELCPKQFTNGNGTVVGANKASFKLETVG